jgi:uncharacterized membrane protein (UPF0127 family)
MKRWLVICLVGLGVVLFTNPTPSNLTINGRTFKLIVSKSETAQEKGLGDRTNLPDNEGMLFVFSNQAIRCFWMKDMHFPLDIIWLSSAKKVVAIRQNVYPSTYPSSFCPYETAQYVIELKAGQVSAAHINAGQQLVF